MNTSGEMSDRDECLIKQTIKVFDTASSVGNLAVALLDKGNALEASILLREMVETCDKNGKDLRELIFRSTGRYPDMKDVDNG